MRARLDALRIELEKVKIRLAENNIQFDITPGLVEYFAIHGYDKTFGARPLKRLIEEKLLDEQALRIIEGKVHTGETIKPIVKNNSIII